MVSLSVEQGQGVSLGNLHYLYLFFGFCLGMFFNEPLECCVWKLFYINNKWGIKQREYWTLGIASVLAASEVSVLFFKRRIRK